MFASKVMIDSLYNKQYTQRQDNSLTKALNPIIYRLRFCALYYVSVVYSMQL